MNSSVLLPPVVSGAGESSKATCVAPVGNRVPAKLIWPNPSTELGRGGAGISRNSLVPYWPGESERAPPTSAALSKAAEGFSSPRVSTQNCRRSVAHPVANGAAMLVPVMKQ
ncbi:MAG: hypothetical protein BWX54_00734 [Verrucomicrobia bacterium ADurb.Bin018]|nr:MAG: hypothetical protein BWX54_00734 [Verrucomicrobia bacterium ADurb.Bin018]